jgi:hypothetical protein
MEPIMAERRKTTRPRNRGPKKQPQDSREEILTQALVATGDPGE